MKILNFGSLNLDYVYQVDHLVKPGETLNALSQAVHPGGKGLNQSVALAKAGAEVFHAGCLGAGGDMLKALLNECSVNTDFLLPVSALQGNAVIQVDRNGENCILLFGGSNRCVTAQQVTETLSHFSAGDWLILQNEINLLPFIIKTAHEKGLRIVLNPSPYDDRLKDVDLHCISWLLVNEVEAAQLSGSSDPEESWRLLHAQYPALSLLITLGKDGSIAFTEGAVIQQEAYPADAVDTTGAGDTYTGYFVASLAEGRPLQECMQRASLAASISVTRPGAAGSIPEKNEVDRFSQKL